MLIGWTAPEVDQLLGFERMEVAGETLDSRFHRFNGSMSFVLRCKETRGAPRVSLHLVQSGWTPV